MDVEKALADFEKWKQERDKSGKKPFEVDEPAVELSVDDTSSESSTEYFESTEEPEIPEIPEELPKSPPPTRKQSPIHENLLLKKFEEARRGIPVNSAKPPPQEPQFTYGRLFGKQPAGGKSWFK